MDFFDNETLASYLLDNESGSGISDEMRKYWKKDDGTMPRLEQGGKKASQSFNDNKHLTIKIVAINCY